INTLQTQSADRKICAFLFWDCGSAKSKTGLYTYSLQPMGLSVENKIFAANHNDLCSNTALTKGWC
ncbi:hypothetical protein, partial [Vibrio parahaemolyticus]|uniref:hypothetical protein n=1 Tax=Vibrio parahaemolyticus TaxID=670 RepID=UPI001E3CE652